MEQPSINSEKVSDSETSIFVQVKFKNTWRSLGNQSRQNFTLDNLKGEIANRFSDILRPFQLDRLILEYKPREHYFMNVPIDTPGVLNEILIDLHREEISIYAKLQVIQKSYKTNQNLGRKNFDNQVLLLVEEQRCMRRQISELNHEIKELRSIVNYVLPSHIDQRVPKSTNQLEKPLWKLSQITRNQQLNQLEPGRHNNYCTECERSSFTFQSRSPPTNSAGKNYTSYSSHEIPSPSPSPTPTD